MLLCWLLGQGMIITGLQYLFKVLPLGVECILGKHLKVTDSLVIERESNRMATQKRWYDVDQKLSKVVHAMEFMNEESQQRFAGKLLELSQEFLRDLGGTDYIETLDAQKREGISKSRAKKRWYDRYESLHTAFNNLYALDNDSRRFIATQLVTPIQIVEGYEKHCKREGKEPDIRVIEEVLRSAFTQGQERTRRLYSLYLNEFKDELDSHNRQQRKKLETQEEPGLWTLLLQSLHSVLI